MTVEVDDDVGVVEMDEDEDFDIDDEDDVEEGFIVRRSSKKDFDSEADYADCRCTLIELIDGGMT